MCKYCKSNHFSNLKLLVDIQNSANGIYFITAADAKIPFVFYFRQRKKAMITKKSNGTCDCFAFKFFYFFLSCHLCCSL